MEFHEKLQQLRKEKELTQEQLAEKLFVSRTAISKWESGKGYPGIDSLKNLSGFFSVSIDDLLSGEELISLAKNENRRNINKISGLVFGILDVTALSFLFFPLYGQPEGGFVRMVTLFSLRDTSALTSGIYCILPLALAVLGAAELLVQHYGNERLLNICKTASLSLQAFTILALIATRQPYATALMFLFFVMKAVFLAKSRRVQ